MERKDPDPYRTEFHLLTSRISFDKTRLATPVQRSQNKQDSIAITRPLPKTLWNSDTTRSPNPNGARTSLSKSTRHEIEKLLVRRAGEKTPSSISFDAGRNACPSTMHACGIMNVAVMDSATVSSTFAEP
jgi:hypothetical protein